MIPLALASAPRPALQAVDDPVAAAAEIVEALQAEAAVVDDAGAPLQSLELLRSRGLCAALLPDGSPGSPALLDPRRRLALLQVLAHVGRGSLSVGRLYEGHVNALALVLAYGNAAQRARAAAAAAAGSLFGVWNTEGAHPVLLDGGLLRGRKTFASGAGIVGCAIVTARVGVGRLQMLLLDVAAQPPRIDRASWQPLGMRATGSFEVDFAGIAVAAGDLLGEPGDYLRQPAFGAGAVRFAAVQQGGIEAVFDATRCYLRALGRCDDPYQRARLGEMAMLAASGRHWLQSAADNANAATTVQVAHAQLMRSAIEDHALRVLQLAERSVGARGLLRPAPFERLHRDLTHYLRQAGPDAAIAAAGAHVLTTDTPAYALWGG